MMFFIRINRSIETLQIVAIVCPRQGAFELHLAGHLNVSQKIVESRKMFWMQLLWLGNAFKYCFCFTTT